MISLSFSDLVLKKVEIQINLLTLFCCARPEELDVKVEGNNIIITAKQEIQEAGGTR
jgi:HSP20 family molecular chaperone IbpA